MSEITDFDIELHTRKDGSRYVSIGDPANGPHQQFDFHGSDDLAVAVAMRFNSHASLVEENARLRGALKTALPRLEDNARFLRDMQAHAGVVAAAFDAVNAVTEALK